MKVMTRSQLTADILVTHLRGYSVFIGVVRKGEGGEIVRRGVHVRNPRDWPGKMPSRPWPR
jgi:hypothetical protein